MLLKKIKLSDVASYFTGKVNTKNLSVNNYISTTNMLPNKEGVISATSLPPSDKINSYEIGDILVSNIRPYFKKIWLAEFSGGCDADILNIRVNKELILPEYLYCVLLRDEFFDYIMVGSKGVKMPRGDKDFIMNYEFIIPVSKDEQQAVLNKIMPFIKKKENNSKIVNNLEEYTQLLFHKWFIDFNFPNAEGLEYKKNGGEFEVKNGKEIPKGWQYDKITNLGTIVAGGTPSTSNEEYFTKSGEGIAWITPNDLSKLNNIFISHGEIDITQSGFKNSSANLMPKGTVLMSSRAPIGYLGISENEVTTNQGFKSIVPKEGISPIFIFFVLKSLYRKFTFVASGTTFMEVSKDVMSRINVVIPEGSVLKKFDEVAAPLFEKISLIEKENKLLEETRDLLIKKMIK